jgi:energy-coupling factor transporter transmembrane protein EcfT
LLAVATTALALSALAFARLRAARLLWRSRWLLLPLAVLFAFFTPGTLLLPALGAASPTLEGIRLALLHGLRLMVVVLAAALLLQYTSTDDLVAGIYGLMRPLRVCGIDNGRVAVRVMLVLRYLESPEALKGWRHWVRPAAEAPGDAPARFHVRTPRLTWADYAALAALTALIVWLVLA